MNHKFLSLAFVLIATFSGCNQSDAWPSRPITLICPWSAGGGTDRIARQVAIQLENELHVPVNVVNATGGGGVTGHTRGALARPDGYTITLSTIELNILHWRGLCPITPDDFQPLVRLNQDSAAIFVLKDTPWSTIDELKEAISTSKKTMRASGTVGGGIWHLAMAGWLVHEDLPAQSVTWISINGAAPALQELMAGGVEIVCCSIPEARALLDSGEIRCLGVMSEQRSEATPEVPTFREQGIDWSMGGWRGLMYPQGVSTERVQIMQNALLKVTHSDEFHQFMENAGFQINIAEEDEFKKFLKKSDSDFGTILNNPEMNQKNISSLGSYFFPSALIIAGSFIMGVRLLTFQKDTAVSSDQETTFNRSRFAYFIIAITLFILFCNTVGYLISATVLLFALFFILRVPVSQGITICLLVVPGLYQLFAGILRVPLPWGWLGWG